MIIYWSMHWFWKLLIAVGVALFIWFTVFLILPKMMPQEVVANSAVHGLLIRNQIWEGTIRVTGDLITGPYTVITLKPGAKLLVAIDGDKSNFDLLPWHNKNGINVNKEYRGVRPGEPFWNEKNKIQLHFHKLVAIGTKQQPIIISSDAVPGSPYDFNVISVDSGVLSNAVVSNYRRFEVGKDVTVRSSRLTNTGECAICITSGRPSIINNVFSSNLREYIRVDRGSPQIADNEFEKSTGAGIRIDPVRIGAPLIFHNNFEMSQTLAIDVVGGGENQGGTVFLNRFSGGTIIQVPCNSRLKFLQNSILGVVSFSTGSCIGSYTFGSNYWGAQDFPTIMSDQIILKEKQFRVSIPVILKEPPIQVGRRE